MKSKLLLLKICVFTSIFYYSQNNLESIKPTFIGTSNSMKIVPPLSSKEHILAKKNTKEIKDGRYYKHDLLIGKDSQQTADLLAINSNELESKLQVRQLDTAFIAIDEDASPTDPDIAVGPNHAIIVFNTGFRIFNKQGTPLTGELDPSNVFGVTGCCDLTVSYDKIADRWVMSLLGGNGAYIAVSSGANPVTSSWYSYNYSQVSDYQKVSVWSDGYYMTDNTSNTNAVYAFERSKMLTGNTSAQILAFPLAGIVTSGFYSPQFLSVSGSSMPAPGNIPIIYLQDDAWAGVANDHVKLWNLNIDWISPANSTISQPVNINVSPFVGVFDGGSFYNLTQPNGTDIDAIQATIMNQARFRKFTTHNSAVFNFVVNALGGTGEKAGIRWIELRQTADGQPWTLYQEGTYTSPDNKHAWCGSIMMDKFGNIGMGYSAMGGTNNHHTGAYYTGRYANDPIGTMTINEELIYEGNGDFSGFFDQARYGDYTKLDIDPSNDITFWFTNEIYHNNGRKNVVGIFNIQNPYNYDVGAVNITNPVDTLITINQNITATIYNYGTQAVSNIPVILKINNITVATVNYTNTLAPNSSGTVTFTNITALSQTNQNYNLQICTNLGTDQNNANNCYTRKVYLPQNKDVGIKEIISPTGNENLINETVTVKIANYGTSAQSNIPLSVKLNNNVVLNQTYTGTIAPFSDVLFTFNNSIYLGASNQVDITVSTELQGDLNTSNNSKTLTLKNKICRNITISPNLNIGPDISSIESIISVSESIVINDIDIKVNIEHTWVNDIIIELITPNNQNIILSNNIGGAGDNYTNTVFDQEAANSINSSLPPYTGSFKPDNSLANIYGNLSNGEWKLKVSDNSIGDGGNLLNWTLKYCSNSLLKIDNILKSEIIFDIINKNDKKYLIKLDNRNTNFESLYIKVHDINGKLLFTKKFNQVNNDFEYLLDMTYASESIYFVNIQSDKLIGTQKILVRK